MPKVRKRKAPGASSSRQKKRTALSRRVIGVARAESANEKPPAKRSRKKVSRAAKGAVNMATMIERTQALEGTSATEKVPTSTNVPLEIIGLNSFLEDSDAASHVDSGETWSGDSDARESIAIEKEEIAPALQVRIYDPRSAARRLASFLMVALAAVALGSVVIRVVDAATFQGPTAAPPAGNIPVTVWNREASGIQQIGASIDIDGGSVAAVAKGLTVGKNTLDLGSAAGGQNVYYGVASYAAMHAADSLLKLQTAAGAAYTDRLNLNKDGDLTVSGCLGKTFVGVTAASFAPSAVLSYYGANNKCIADFPGSHVCRDEEILESISCSVAGDKIRDPVLNGTGAWVIGGTPGFNVQANDCNGWSASDQNSYGRSWNFKDTTGGSGTTTTCNTPGIPFACCR